MSKSITKRLRIFAGPNGSGKSTLAKNLPKKRISLGVFVNADEIENSLNKNKFLSLYKYKFVSNTKALQEYILVNGMSAKKLNNPDIHKFFVIKSNRIYYSGEFNSYLAADIAGFVRNQLLLKGRSFSFETVFSHESKLEIMRFAGSLGYRVYFYFLATEDPEININRVDIRTALKGHYVPEDKIINRYYRSLNLMYDAVKLSTRAYLFDNSGKYYKLLAQIDYGKNVEILVEEIPNWFVKYLYNKMSHN